jgi:aryl-alcohol dehydrogenase-like predicted oxidoreductase
MKRRKLGELEVSALGLGCMGMTPVYGEPDPAEAIATLRRAVELGCDFIDTADVYGDGENEKLVGRGLKGIRDKVTLASKFGNVRFPDGTRGVNGRPDYVPKACDESLQRLGVEVIDLYYLHRVDDKVPIEDTVGAMGRLVEAGKVRFIGLSEAGPATIRKAHATYPITALQTEYSLWAREPEEELLKLCAELGIGFVAYSPLGRGLLTGTLGDGSNLSQDDRRREHPRFQGDNLAKNNRLVAALEECARAENCTPSQLALAWVLAQPFDIVPIPGTKRRKWLEENVAALDLEPSRATMEQLDEVFRPGAGAGTRYPAGQMKRVGI